MNRDAAINGALVHDGILPRLFNLLCRPYLSSLVASEVSSFSRYYDILVQLKVRTESKPALFSRVDCPVKYGVDYVNDLPNFSADQNQRGLFLLNGNLNHQYDVEGLLEELKQKLNRSSRVCVIVYNTYWRWIYWLANHMGIRRGELPTTYFTRSSISNICALAGFEIVRARPVAYFPLRFFGLGTLINRILQAFPILRWTSFSEVLLLRPIIPSADRPALSVVVPARNERGNIENTVKRSMSAFKFPFELIFVEGHSSDQTWEEIKRVEQAYQGLVEIQSFRQPGKGKNDAVQLGFSRARHELLTILDADLSMPPELLPRFYEAYVTGKADFINGSRLVYPMEGGAMRFLNWMGNVFFAKSLSWVLDAQIGDSLCGTKLVNKRDYGRFCAWRKDFGEFDPFGDFEFLFPAAVLGLGIKDVPIRYRARVYGSTNIRRFHHGFMLLRMTLIGFLRIRMSLGSSLSRPN